MESSGARDLMRRIDEEVAELGQAGMGAAGGRLVERLASDWTSLVDLIGPIEDPYTRPCPSCGRMGMPDATRCGYCWVALEPLARPPAPGRGEGRRRPHSERSALSAFESEGGAL